MAFGGSGGGLGPAAGWAPLLAAHGFATLAVAYFGAPGLPKALVEIEIEVVERASRWLLNRNDTAPGSVAVMGMSRGSELALWSGALLDTVGAVVALAPSAISWAGLDGRGPVDAPAWTFRGKPLPWVPIAGTAKQLAGAASTSPLSLRPAFEAVLADPERFASAVIPVEDVGGPILFITGEADTMWPSTPMTEIAEQRTRTRGFPHRLVHLRYPDGGHICGGVPGVPVVTEVRHPLTGGLFSFGGTKAANAHARAHSWPQILTFLRDAAAGRSPIPRTAGAAHKLS